MVKVIQVQELLKEKYKQKKEEQMVLDMIQFLFQMVMIKHLVKWNIN